jgi:hypothetical protein
MASDDIGQYLEQFYTIEELVELYRDNLRRARSSPPGAQRDQHRKIARSLKALFKSKSWHTGTAPKKAGIRRRMRIQDVQLTAAKVSNPGIRGKARNSPDNSKGISQLGMSKFESSQVSQAVGQLEIVHTYIQEMPANCGLL